MKFSRSLVKEWEAYRQSAAGQGDLRAGQSFYNWFNLHKVYGEDKLWCDKLYNLDGVPAWQAIDAATDWEN